MNRDMNPEHTSPFANDVATADNNICIDVQIQ